MGVKASHRRARQGARAGAVSRGASRGRQSNRPNGDAVSQSLKLAFVDEICAALREQNLTRSALAARLGTSRQYITRVLNYSTNFTIESMAEIAAALGRELTIQVLPHDRSGRNSRLTKRESA